MSCPPVVTTTTRRLRGLDLVSRLNCKLIGRWLLTKEARYTSVRVVREGACVMWSNRQTGGEDTNVSGGTEECFGWVVSGS